MHEYDFRSVANLMELLPFMSKPSIILEGFMCVVVVLVVAWRWCSDIYKWGLQLHVTM